MAKLFSRYDKFAFILIGIVIATLCQHLMPAKPAVAEPQILTQQVQAQGSLVWFRLATNSNFIVNAAKVPGGWFICTQDPPPEGAQAGPLGGVFFYPDIDHRWNGGSLP